MSKTDYKLKQIEICVSLNKIILRFMLLGHKNRA